MSTTASLFKLDYSPLAVVAGVGCRCGLVGMSYTTLCYKMLPTLWKALRFRIDTPDYEGMDSQNE